MSDEVEIVKQKYDQLKTEVGALSSLISEDKLYELRKKILEFETEVKTIVDQRQKEYEYAGKKLNSAKNALLEMNRFNSDVAHLLVEKIKKT